jgi:hypothetical protein
MTALRLQGALDSNDLERVRGLEVTMHVVVFLLFGLVFGVLARVIVSGREPGGWVLSLLLGLHHAVTSR